MSTDALRKKFKKAIISAVDTSKEMLDVAKKFSYANCTVDDAESVSLHEPADLITIMFAFHEIPQEGRIQILKNAHNNLVKGGHLLVVDIDMAYSPSEMMLTGEPYIHDYLENVQTDIRKIFPHVLETVIIPGHVRQWIAPKY